jgi:hypothetical protein
VPIADIGEIIRARKRKIVLGRLSKIQTLPSPAEQSYRIEACRALSLRSNRKTFLSKSLVTILTSLGVSLLEFVNAESHRHKDIGLNVAIL